MKTENVVLSIIVSTGLIFVIFELVRRKKLNEEYSWLWMLTGAVLLTLSLFPKLLLFIARVVGIAVASNVMFFFGVLFLVLIVLHFSIVISKLTNDINTLTQKIALLEHELKSKGKEMK